jgi:hypothetical protein
MANHLFELFVLYISARRRKMKCMARAELVSREAPTPHSAALRGVMEGRYGQPFVRTVRFSRNSPKSS